MSDRIPVVTKKLLGAFARAMVAAASGLDEVGEEWDETMQGMWEESYDEAVARFTEYAPTVLSTVLPNVRWAKEVLGPLNGALVSYMVSLEGTGLPEQHNLDPGDGLMLHRNLNDGDTIAVLEREAPDE